MSNTNNTKPSNAGVRGTGLELRKRPQAQTPAPTQQDRVTTQRPNAPTTSNRGYA